MAREPVVIDVPMDTEPSLLRTLGVGASRLIPGLATQVLPPGQPVEGSDVAPASGFERVLPGAVTGLYNLPDAIYNAVTGEHTSIPGMQRAGELFDLSRQSAISNIPTMTPTNSQEEVAADIGEAVGGVALPVPGVKVGPRALRVAADLLLPGSPHPVRSSALMGGLGGVIAGAQGRGNEANATPVIDVPMDGGRPSSTVTEDANPFQGQATPGVIDVPMDTGTKGMTPQQRVDFYANKHGVPLALAHAVIGQESGYNTNAVNRESGASGMGQLMPDTARGLGVTNVHDPDQNLDASMAYLRHGIDREGSVQGAARYYYGGPNTQQWGQRTESYAQTIARRYAQNVQRGMASDVGPGNTVIDVPTDIVVPMDEETTPENWKLITGGALAMGAALLGPRAVRSVRQLAGIGRDQIYAGKAAEFNAKHATLATGADPSTLPSAPVAGNTLGTRIQGAVQDANAPLLDFADQVSSTPGMAERLKSQINLFNNAVSQNERFATFMQHGIDQRTGNRYIAPEMHIQRVLSSGEDNAELYHRARWYLNERDNRYVNAGRGLVGPDQYVSLWNTPTRELDRVIRTAMANPVVNDLLQEAKLMTRQTMERARDWGYLTQQEFQDITRMHPWHLASVDTQGRPIRVLGEREYTTRSGSETMTAKAWDIDRQHQYGLHRDLEQKTLQSSMIQAGLGFQRRNPGAAKMIEEVTTSSGAPGPATPSQNVLRVPIGGQWRTFRVYSPSFYKALHFDPHTGGGVLKGFNMAKNTLQSWTTGPMAALIGHPFFAVQFLRGIHTTSAIRPAGTATGVFDAATRRLSGGRFGLPGDVPGTALLNVHGLLADTMSRGALLIGEAFRKGNNQPFNRLLRSLLGDNLVDTISQRAIIAHEKSVLFERRLLGLTGASGQASREVPVAVEGARAERVFIPGKKETWASLSNVPVLLRPGVWGALNIRSFLHEIHSLFSDAAAGSFYRLNTGHTPGMKWAKSQYDRETIAAMTRDLLGDPGKRGGSGFMKRATDVVPYLNIAIQDNARLMKAFKDNPAGTMMRLTLSLSMGAAASILTAMSYGPEAIEFLKKRISNGTAAGEMIFFGPRDQPLENYTGFSMSQRERFMYPAILSLMGDALSVWEHYMDPDAHMTASQALSQFLSHHIEPEVFNRTLAGVSAAWSPPVPGPIQAGAALLGKQVTPTWENLLSPNKSSSSMIQRMTMPTPGQGVSPQHEAGVDPITGTITGNALIQAMSALLGFGGSFVTAMGGDIVHGYRWGNDAWDIASHVVDRWKQGFMDEARGYNNVLWSNENALVKGTEANEVLNNKMIKLREVMTAHADILNGDQTRRGGPIRQVEPGTNKLSSDPVMQAAALATAKQANLIDQAYMRPLRDINKAIEDVERSGQSPLIIRHEKNKLLTQRQGLVENALAMFNIIDNTLTSVIGKPVRVEDVDWTKGVEQFSQ